MDVTEPPAGTWTLEGFNEDVTLEEEAVIERDIIPLNLPILAIVTIPDADEPPLAAMLDGFTVTLKSPTLTVTPTECDTEPLVPVIVKVYTPPVDES